MTRNVRTYDHFCLTARALERVGDRWSLLVIRDLLTGAKRFTDLMDRLGGITPKTLSQRLRELDDAGIVAADREAGRREVWYRLTPTGADLAPVIDALGRWGLRHTWRLPRPGEPLHGEHLLRAATQAIDLASDDHEPARWHIRLDGACLTIHFRSCQSSKLIAVTDDEAMRLVEHGRQGSLERCLGNGFVVWSCGCHS